MSDEQRERDEAAGERARDGRIGINYAIAFADGAEHARATDPVRKLIGTRKLRKLAMRSYENSAEPGWRVVLTTGQAFEHDGPTPDEACARALAWLESDGGGDDRG